MAQHTRSGRGNRGVIVVLTGVSGAGKTTVGEKLAQRLGWTFIEGDDFHSQANRAKIARGEPLNDDDRKPWLTALRERMDAAAAADACAVLTCSALKETYRDALRGSKAYVRFVLLDAPPAILHERLEGRADHFADERLLESQLKTLERRADVPTIDATCSVDEVVQSIIDVLELA